MKKLLFLCLAFFLSAGSFAQNSYWAVYHFKVKDGHEGEVVRAMNKYFSSEASKTLPASNFNASLFSSSKDKWTHQMVFYSDDKNDFAEMYSGKLQGQLEFQLLGSAMDHTTEGVASYLGKRVLGEPVAGNSFTTVYELSVSDPAAYVEAFTELRNAALALGEGKIGVQLHAFLSGNELGATHAATISAPDMGTMLDFTDKLFASDAMKSFAAKAKPIRKRLRTFSTVNINRYNLPEGM